MNSLLKLLPSIIRLSGDNEQVREQAVFGAWRVVAGTELAHHCVPFRLHQKQLNVAVADRVWQVQMMEMSGEMLARLNATLGESLVTFIEFWIDPNRLVQARAAEPQPLAFQHTQEIKDELRPAAERIRDEALRELFLDAAAKYLERNQPIEPTTLVQSP